MVIRASWIWLAAFVFLPVFKFCLLDPGSQESK